MLREEGHDVRGHFYNPNIHPASEYRKRLETLDVYAGKEKLPVMREDAYPVAEFLRQVAFREEDRCRHCYRLRLAATARMAKEGGFDAFTTTLLYSRFQKHDLIRSVGDAVETIERIPFLYRDFREGWSEGVRISKERAMYRQQYCGCIYSEKDRYYPAPQSNPA
jgi:predicted adenine nucleotide alpha hydrolase (AANH) superfamily ATPase